MIAAIRWQKCPSTNKADARHTRAGILAELLLRTYFGSPASAPPHPWRVTLYESARTQKLVSQFD